jgi:hypothetical protein
MLNRGYQTQFCEALDDDVRTRLLALLNRPEGRTQSLWDQLKQEPKRATSTTQFKEFLHHLQWLQRQNVGQTGTSAAPL